MQTIRRLYLYAVSFISLEVVLWGIISLARSAAAGDEIGGSVNRLAGALALILVGIPIFWLHWRLAQLSASREIEERASRLRAVFLYGTLLATLVPVTQNALSLLNHLLLRVFGLTAAQAMLGGSQSASDNLIAIAINALAALYFYSILRADHLIPSQNENLIEVQRLYRYIWLVYGLAMVVFGVQQTLQFILLSPQAVGTGIRSILANGLALLLIGAPLWVFTGRIIQGSLDDPTERQSLLRLAVLFGVVIISVTGGLVSTGMVLHHVLEVAFGARPGLAGFLTQISDPLSIAIPLGLVWAYYDRTWNDELNAMPDDLRRLSLRRLYYYTLALLGLGATFIGLQLTLSLILDLALSTSILGGTALRDQLALSISTLAVGLPLWIITWRPMAREAAQEGERGDHARLSLVRKSYLFLTLFIGVMGVMFGTGVMLYQVFRALLGQPAENLLLDVAQQLRVILLFSLLAAYHWQALRQDGRMAERSLAKRYAQFPVLVLVPAVSLQAEETAASIEETGTNEDLSTPKDFADQIVKALQQQSPALPVAIHPTNLGAPDESLSTARAVILPAELIVKSPEAIRLWLQSFTGPRLVVPTPAKGWSWIAGNSQSLPSLARQTAQIVRRLAEGGIAPASRETSPLTVLMYVLAGLFVLELILALVGFGASLIFR
jgi:hypothetical protein